MRAFQVSVAEILGRPGEYRDLDLSEAVEGVTTALARLAPEPIDARLRLESVVEGVLVTGPVTGRARLECARCLSSFEDEVSLELCEIYFAPGHDAPKNEDAYRVTGSEIDLEAMLRDALALALPLNPLCRDACAGICAQCGRDLNLGPCDCTTDETDPRWAPLAALREKLQG